MLKISTLIGQQLKWTQPHAFAMQYELRAGDALVATLDFKNDIAVAISADGNWTFRQTRNKATKYIVRAIGRDEDLGVFNKNTKRQTNYWSKDGTLELPDGRKYPVQGHLSQTKFDFRSDRGKPLISYDNSSGLLHLSANVEIHDLAKDVPELPWMVILGWYMLVCMKREFDAKNIITV